MSRTLFSYKWPLSIFQQKNIYKMDNLTYLTCCLQRLASVPFSQAAWSGIFTIFLTPIIGGHKRLLYKEHTVHIRASLLLSFLLTHWVCHFYPPVFQATPTCESIRYFPTSLTPGAQHISYVCFPCSFSPYTGEALWKTTARGTTCP